MECIRFIDLFAGIGGFRYGLEKTGKHIQKQGTGGDDIRPNRDKSDTHTSKKRGKSGNAFNCVYSNEWDKYASQIYKRHFGECDTRDITKVPSSEIPDHDLLVGGFPCQAFSVAGKRKGFDDTRGTLFFEIARILNDKRPRYFLLENVKGLLSHDSSKTFQTILGVLTSLGYEYQWQVLNSKNFGVPQNRERVFIIGHLRGQPRPKVFPIGESSKIPDKKKQRNSGEIYLKYVGAVMGEKNKMWMESDKKHSRYFPQGQRVWDSNGIAPTLSGEGGGWGGKTGLYETTGTLMGIQRIQGTGEAWKRVLKNTKLLKIRRLTPTECERLQGFPDSWTEGISDTQRYKCLGNAVTTNVVSYIGTQLLKGE